MGGKARNETVDDLKNELIRELKEELEEYNFEINNIKPLNGGA